MFSVTKRLEFSAGHRLRGVEKCSAIHGHNYRVEVTLVGDCLSPTGMVLDFHAFKPLEEWIEVALDHALILHSEDVELASSVKRKFLLPGPPTAELLAKTIFKKAQELLPLPEGVRVKKVVVFETECGGAYEE